MRVITGTARGMKLATIPGMEVRPTSERVKEAVFSALQFDIPGAKVLDLYAGSGQMGIEALSRGAAGAVFVDMQRESSAVEIENLKKAKLFQKSRVVTMEVRSFLMSTKEKFDIVFLDPPYASVDTDDIILLTAAKTADTGAIFCETDAKRPLRESAGEFIRTKEYFYGRTKISVYRKGTSTGEENSDMPGQL